MIQRKKPGLVELSGRVKRTEGENTVVRKRNEVWQMMKKMSGKKKESQRAGLEDEETIGGREKEKAHVFRKSFVHRHSGNHLNEPHPKHKEEALKPNLMFWTKQMVEIQPEMKS